MRRRGNPTDHFVSKGLDVYPEILVCVKDFEGQILNCCEKVLERYLLKLRASLGMMFQPDRIKREPPAFDKDAADLGVSVGSVDYLWLGVRWITKGSGRQLEAYAALYCPRRFLADTLSQKLENEGFGQPEDWGSESSSEWYIPYARPITASDTKSLIAALEESLEQWIKVGGIVRNATKRLNNRGSINSQIVETKVSRTIVEGNRSERTRRESSATTRK